MSAECSIIERHKIVKILQILTQILKILKISPNFQMLYSRIGLVKYTLLSCNGSIGDKELEYQRFFYNVLFNNNIDPWI